jgi:hypothetical protein
MPRLSLWRKDKSNDYKFLDRNIKEQFMIGGTAIMVHKYVGPAPQNATNDPTEPNYKTNDIFNETTIQDVLLLENRDRKYDQDIYELRGIYNVSDQDFDLTQFGLFINTDTLFINFHLNDMVERLGRKLMSGDVIEIPHQRDDLTLDPTSVALNKWYVVQDASRASEGYSQTWWPHLWRIKVNPLSDAQEFKDILGQASDPTSLGDLIGSYKHEMAITDAIVDAATKLVPDMNADVSNLFNYTEPDKGGVMNAEKFSAYYGKDVESGAVFPMMPRQGDLFMRTDFSPNSLFTYKGTRWCRIYDNIFPSTKEVVTDSVNAGQFINNTSTGIAPNGEEYTTRQPLGSVIKPRTDF